MEQVMSITPRAVTLIPGDGIGPECVRSAQRILEAAGALLTWEEHHAGESVFKRGIPSGVPAETIESIRRTRLVLKGPLGTPVGYGEKSANVTLRKLFETFANVRPVRELPGVVTPYTGRKLDLVVIRENVEDLYAGIEHQQSPSVAQCLKLISRKGCEKIVRFAFEYARAEGRKKVHCATKSNIMKLTEGLLKRTFERIAPEYPGIEANHIIIDNCAHQLVKKPEQFDVIVTTNMNGDIISDLTSALIGGLGFAPSANIGNEVAIFEAVHGTAPKYAGKDVINPLAVVLSAVLMLRYLGDSARADRIENAIYYTLEAGQLRTGDVVGYDQGCRTSALTDEIIKNLGQTAVSLRAVPQRQTMTPVIHTRFDAEAPRQRRVIGLDLFLETPHTPAELGAALEALAEGHAVKLKMISNRGTQVYPATGAITDCVDQFRCRFLQRQTDGDLSDADLLKFVAAVAAKHRWMHIEKLQEFDGTISFTKAQGED
jgi:isocitrate dehydrogenase